MTFSADFFLIFVQNLVFQHLIGLSGAANAKKHRSGLLLHGALSLFFCTAAAGLTVLLRPLLPLANEKLLIPFCCAVITGATDLFLVLIASHSAVLNRILLPYLHNAAFSGAVLGAVMLTTAYTHEASVAFRYGFQTGCGYLAACCMLHFALPAFNSKKMPKILRGWRGLYLYAGILAMAAACMFPT